MDCHGNKEIPKTVYLESLESSESIKDKKSKLPDKVSNPKTSEVKTRSQKDDIQIKPMATN